MSRRAEPPHAAEFHRRFRPDQRVAWTQFLRTASRLMAETGADLERRHQLTLSAYDALQMLAWAGADGMTIGELSERVLLSPSGISRVVDRLEREGFVERRPGSRDTRQRIARVTAAGLEKLVAATPDHLDAIQAGFLDHLTVEETRVLAKALAKTARRGGPAAVGPEVSP